MPRVAPKAVKAISFEALMVQITSEAMMQCPAATTQGRGGPGRTQELWTLHFHGGHGTCRPFSHPPLEAQLHVDVLLRFCRLILARDTEELGWQGTRHQLEPSRHTKNVP